MHRFDHERLKVYHDSILFVDFAGQLLERIQKSQPIRTQLDRASTAIPLNIAEGNGKYTAADRCRFFDIARGSALECAACLDVMVIKHLITVPRAEEGKDLLKEIVAMLVGLIRSNSDSREV